MLYGAVLQSASVVQEHTLFVVSQEGPAALPEQSVFDLQEQSRRVVSHLAPAAVAALQSASALHWQPLRPHLAPEALAAQFASLRHGLQVPPVVLHLGAVVTLQSPSFLHGTWHTNWPMKVPMHLAGAAQSALLEQPQIPTLVKHLAPWVLPLQSVLLAQVQ